MERVIWRRRHGDGALEFTNRAGDVILLLDPSTGGVLLPNLPTSDPLVAGELWSNTGVLTVSAGA